jgi:hypothetical protein
VALTISVFGGEVVQRRLAAMVTMLDAACAAAGSAERDQWCLANWGAVCAHIGAAQRIETVHL